MKTHQNTSTNPFQIATQLFHNVDQDQIMTPLQSSSTSNTRHQLSAYLFQSQANGGSDSLLDSDFQSIQQQSQLAKNNELFHSYSSQDLNQDSIFTIQPASASPQFPFSTLLRHSTTFSTKSQFSTSKEISSSPNDHQRQYYQAKNESSNKTAQNYRREMSVEYEDKDKFKEFNEQKEYDQKEIKNDIVIHSKNTKLNVFSEANQFRNHQQDENQTIFINSFSIPQKMQQLQQQDSTRNTIYSQKENNYIQASNNSSQEIPFSDKNVPLSQTKYQSKQENTFKLKLQRDQKYMDTTKIIENLTSQRRLTRGSTNPNQNVLNHPSKYNKKIKNKEQPSSTINDQTVNKPVRLKKDSKHQNIPIQITLQEEKSCAVCLGAIEVNYYGKIACSHEFCLDCISQWAQVTNKCPICRSDFLEIIVKNDKKQHNTRQQQRITVKSKKQHINDEDEFYWEETSSSNQQEDEICYICQTDYDEEKLIICDLCEVRICHTYCDNDLCEDLVPSQEWFCHDCRQKLKEKQDIC